MDERCVGRLDDGHNDTVDDGLHAKCLAAKTVELKYTGNEIASHRRPSDAEGLSDKKESDPQETIKDT